MQPHRKFESTVINRAFFAWYFAIARCVYGCVFAFLPNGKTARLNVAMGDTAESKNVKLNLRETCLCKMMC